MTAKTATIIRDVPLSKIVPSDKNVRRTGRDGWCCGVGGKRRRARGVERIKVQRGEPEKAAYARPLVGPPGSFQGELRMMSRMAGSNPLRNAWTASD
jgi:hypothetical protein